MVAPVVAGDDALGSEPAGIVGIHPAREMDGAGAGIGQPQPGRVPARKGEAFPGCLTVGQQVLKRGPARGREGGTPPATAHRPRELVP